MLKVYLERLYKSWEEKAAIEFLTTPNIWDAHTVIFKDGDKVLAIYTNAKARKKNKKTLRSVC